LKGQVFLFSTEGRKNGTCSVLGADTDGDNPDGSGCLAVVVESLLGEVAIEFYYPLIFRFAFEPEDVVIKVFVQALDEPAKAFPVEEVVVACSGFPRNALFESVGFGFKSHHPLFDDKQVLHVGLRLGFCILEFRFHKQKVTALCGSCLGSN